MTVVTRLRAGLTGRFGAVWWATAALFAASPLIAPGSLASSSLLSMLPFAAVLAIATLGQTLVVQQRGLDLSVPGSMALAAVLVTKIPEADPGRLPVAVAVALLASAAAGVGCGLAVTRLRITPLVATLGVNAALLGLVLRVSGGSPTGAADELNRFALDKSAGIPNTVLVACGLAAVLAFALRRTAVGHRLAAVGVSERAARALGIPVSRYQICAYGLAGGCYGAAGVLLAGYIKTPGIFLGDAYLLPTVAAVVLGGTALSGGVASVLASAVAALFFTQLNQLLLARGWPTSAQLLAQSAILVLVVATREGIGRLPAGLRRWRRRPVPPAAGTARSTSDTRGGGQPSRVAGPAAGGQPVG
jgi:ribose transport system permease protein